MRYRRFTYHGWLGWEPLLESDDVSPGLPKTTCGEALLRDICGPSAHLMAPAVIEAWAPGRCQQARIAHRATRSGIAASQCESQIAWAALSLAAAAASDEHTIRRRGRRYRCVPARDFAPGHLLAWVRDRAAAIASLDVTSEGYMGRKHHLPLTEEILRDRTREGSQDPLRRLMVLETVAEAKRRASPQAAKLIEARESGHSWTTAARLLRIPSEQAHVVMSQHRAKLRRLWPNLTVAAVLEA